MDVYDASRSCAAPITAGGKEDQTMQQHQPQQQVQRQGQQPQQQFQQGQQYQQTFDQYLPEQVSQAVYQLEQLESDAEWAHGQAMQAGDSQTAKALADIAQIIHLQKTLLLRESMFAPAVGQCTQQAIQQSTQQLQQSQIPGVQEVVQQSQGVAQTITQATSQVGRVGQQSDGQIGQPQQFGGQSF